MENIEVGLIGFTKAPWLAFLLFFATLTVMLQLETQLFRICLFAIRCRSALGQRLPPRRTTETTTCSRLNLTMSHFTHQQGKSQRRLFHDNSKFLNCIRSCDGEHCEFLRAAQQKASTTTCVCVVSKGQGGPNCVGLTKSTTTFRILSGSEV